MPDRDKAPPDPDARLAEVARVCIELIRVAFAAKPEANHEREIHEHNEVVARSDSLSREVAAYFDAVGRTAGWGTDVAWLQARYLAKVWEASSSEQADLAGGFASELRRLLELISNTEWLAILPVERRFAQFPEYTQFGEFAIVNPARRNPADGSAGLAEILTAHFGVNFQADEPKGFASRLESIRKATWDTVPRYPQLVASLGHHGPNEAWRGVLTAARSYLPLIACCTFIYDCLWNHEGIEPREPGEVAGAPQASRRLREFVRPIAFTGLALSIPTGAARIFDVGIIDFEVGRIDANSGEWVPGQPLDPERYLKLWGSLTDVLFQLQRNATESASLVDAEFIAAIDRAIRQVARCKYALIHNLIDVLSHIVVAADAIQRQFGGAGSEEDFAALGSALVADNAEQRKEWYATAKELYGYRSLAFHRAMVLDEGRQTISQVRDAVRFFYLCLQRVYDWARDELAGGRPINKKTCREFRQVILRRHQS